MATDFSSEIGFEPIETDDLGFEPVALDQYQSVLRASPEESMLTSALRGTREFFSPLIGPTERQIQQESVPTERGMEFRPAGSRAEREGLIPSLFMQNPESPLFIERAEIDPNASTPAQIATGARNVGANLVNALSSPGSLLTLGAGGLMSPGATRALGGAFAADVARHVPEMATEAGRASVEGGPGEVTESLGNLGLAGAGVLAGGIHAAQSTPRGNAIRAITSALDEGPVNVVPPDVGAVAALDPVRGEWQPLDPLRTRMAPDVARRIISEGVESGLMDVPTPEGRTPIDALLSERRFAENPRVQPPSSEIIPVTRSVRETAEGGFLPLREYPEPRLTRGDYEPPVDVPPKAERQGQNQPLRSQSDILAQRLQQRDMLDAISRMGDEQATAKAKLIDDVLGVGKEPVPLEAAAKTIFDETWEAELQKALDRSGPKPGYWERVQKWSDHTISEGKKRVSSGVDPTIALAYSLKMADAVAKGAIKTFDAFKTEFLKRFPDAADYVRDVWDRLAAKDADIIKAIDDSVGIEGLNNATRSFGGSVTSLAYRIGEMTNTPQKLARLDEGMAKFRQQATEAIKAGDFDKASALAMKGQFYREAREYATGSGSAGTAMRSQDPSFVAPMERGDRFITALDRGIQKFTPDRTQVMEGVTGLPVWLTRDVARGVLQAVKVAYTGTKSLASAIDQGVQWLKQNGVKAEDAAMRDWLDSQLRWERLGSEADSGPTQTRRFAERVMSSSEVAPEVRQALAQDPDIKYQQQRVRRRPGVRTVEDIVGEMSEGQLQEMTSRSNLYGSARIELAKRMMKDGRNAEAARVIKDLAAEGTLFGQIINQLQQLKGVDPSHAVRLLNRQLVDNGYDPLTDAKAVVLEGKSKAAIEAYDKVNKAKQKWMDDPTDENAKAVDAASESAKKPVLDLQKEMLALQPKSLPAVLKAVIQGNLLTPTSQVANIAGNMAFMPARGLSDLAATGIDTLDAFLWKRPRDLVAQPVAGTRAGVRGAIEGIKEIPGILKEGISNVRTGEQFRDLQPLKAWIKLTSQEPSVPTRGGKVPLSDKAALLIEGTAGVPAAGMLRLLSAGDAPFRAKARAQAVEQQLELAKMPASQREFARKFPELFLDENQMKRIQDETAGAVFQRDSETVRSLNAWLRRVGEKYLGRNGGDWADLAFTVTAAPYRLTPWNLVGEYLSYTPAGLASFVAKATKGDRLGAERALAKVMVGGMATAAAWWLYDKGLLSPSLDDRDEQQKARLLSGAVQPPDHINLSGLNRALAREDPTFKPGDETVGIEKLGIFGSIAHNTANMGRKRERAPEGEGLGVMDFTLGPVTETAKFALDQSFLKGTASALEAIKTGNPDSVLRGIENTLVSAPLPNTLGAASHASSKNKVVIKDDNKLKEFGNLIQQRLRVAGAGKDLPISRDVWGQPVPETPKGSFPWAYHFLDITKNQQVTQDPASVEVYRLWRRYNDSSVIPTPPSARLETEGSVYELNPQQKSDLESVVGGIRKRIVDAYVANPNFQKLGDEQKVGMLKRAYETGLRVGKKQFMLQHGAELERRNRPAGFAR
jgi:hypothetical protein